MLVVVDVVSADGAAKTNGKPVGDSCSRAPEGDFPKSEGVVVEDTVGVVVGPDVDVGVLPPSRKPGFKNALPAGAADPLAELVAGVGDEVDGDGLEKKDERFDDDDGDDVLLLFFSKMLPNANGLG